MWKKTLFHSKTVKTIKGSANTPIFARRIYTPSHPHCEHDESRARIGEVDAIRLQNLRWSVSSAMPSSANTWGKRQGIKNLVVSKMLKPILSYPHMHTVLDSPHYLLW